MRPDCAVVVHPDLASYRRLAYTYLSQDLPGPNAHTHHKIRRGNVDDAFEKADLIVENRFSLPSIAHCQLEPFNSYAYMESDGSLTVWTSVHQLFPQGHRSICGALELPPSKVRARASYIGGNFGAAARAERFAALLALKTRKPVRVIHSREECFIDGLNRMSAVIYIKDGVRSDGTLLAREMKLIYNGGAYAGVTPLVVRNGSFAVSQYRTPNFKWDGYGVYTNQPPCGPLRGFGSPQVFWAIEQQMDVMAGKLGMDPVDLRRKNIVREGEEDVRGEITHSIGAEECLDKVAEWIGWGKPSETPVGSIRKGKGLALANKYTMADTVSAAIVKVHKDGTIEFHHGSDEVGQGSNTVLSQIVAEEFGIPMEKVKVIWGDTAVVPYDFGAVSSRTTFMTGNAIRLACHDVKRQIFEMAAPRLEVGPEDLAIRDGKVYLRESPEKVIMIGDLFLPNAKGAQRGALCLAEGGELLGKATFFFKDVSDEDPQMGQRKKLTASYCYTAQAAEVAVDIKTGEVKVLRFCSASDVGQAINPKLCEGQMEGGAGMGIGSALYEEIILDKGKIANPNFADYKVPTTMEIPSGGNLESMIVQAVHKDGPFGAKGVGEVTMTASAPAIANAIYNATGVRIMDLPMTPEKVLKSLREEGGA